MARMMEGLREPTISKPPCMSVNRFSQDHLAGQRTICDGRSDEIGTQDDHDPGQRVHSVIGRVLSEEQPKQTCSHDRADILRSAQQSGTGKPSAWEVLLLSCGLRLRS
jgi:hypothetical protein